MKIKPRSRVQLAVLATIVAIPGLLLIRGWRREQLNNALIDSIDAAKYEDALAILNQGADAAAVKHEEGYEPGLLDRFRAAVGWPESSDSAENSTHKPPHALELMYTTDGLGGSGSDAAFQRLAVRLIEKGSPLSFQVSHEMSLCRLAVRLHHHSVLNALLDLHPDLVDPSALLLADATDTQTLLAHGVNIETVEKYSGRTAVFGADPAKLNVLAINKARIDVRDTLGNTPLMEDAGTGLDESVLWLLDHGAELKVVNKNGATPILYAAWGCRLETIKKLAALGGDIRARTTTGVTALMGAANNTDERVIPWIIEQGVDVNALDHQGKSALDCTNEFLRHAGERGMLPAKHYQDMIAILKAHGAKEGMSKR